MLKARAGARTYTLLSAPPDGGAAHATSVAVDHEGASFTSPTATVTVVNSLSCAGVL